MGAMRLYHRSLKVGEGLRIDGGDGRTIDVCVDEVSGPSRGMSAKLTVTTQDNEYQVEVDPSNPPFKLFEDFMLGAAHAKTPVGQRVGLGCTVPIQYKYEKYP